VAPTAQKKPCEIETRAEGHATTHGHQMRRTVRMRRRHKLLVSHRHDDREPIRWAIETIRTVVGAPLGRNRETQ
jgi:hypothetical protein